MKENFINLNLVQRWCQQNSPIDVIVIVELLFLSIFPSLAGVGYTRYHDH